MALAQDADTAPTALSALIAELKSSPTGLSSEEAAARLSQFGRNEIDGGAGVSLLGLVLTRLREPLALLLIGAAALAGLMGQHASFAIIIAMVALGVVLDTLQEHRADRAAQLLKAQVALQESVLRDGREVIIPAAEIVPGDVVRLSAGDVVPADGRVLAADTFSVNEATLTGEPYPVAKAPGEDSGDRPLAERASAVFMGASVVSGKAEFLVTATGRRTELGKLAGRLTAPGPTSALDRGAQSFGFLIMRLTTLLALFVLITHLALGRPFFDALLFALALAVGLTPELLPMVVAVTLSRGAVRLAEGKAIVKRLAAIHDLGAMDVLCTDKTGTLTEARIRFARALSAEGADSAEVLRLAYLNSAYSRGLESPLDVALRAAAEDQDGWAGLDEAPFDFERRRASVLLARGDERMIVTKGAPEETLAACAFTGTPGGSVRPLASADRDAARERVTALGENGERALAVAWKYASADAALCGAEDETELVFAGFVTFTDPAKASAGASIAELAKLHVAVKVLTGDSAAVTRRICKDIGFDVTEVLEGRDVDRLDEAGLAAAAQRANVFCRLTPVQKNRIILSLRRRGAVVGYVGDGVNDAPSLHDADVGLSVDGAVDVAREAADIILLAPDLSILAQGVREGRRTFGNIMKYVMMAVSSNFGNMLSMAGAALFLPFFPMTAIQILLNNLIYDVSETTIPLDRVDPEDLTHPRTWDMKHVTRFMLIMGPISSVFDFLTFGLLLFVFKADASMFQSAWFTESLASQTLVVFVIRTAHAPWRSRPHPWLAASAGGAAALAFLIPATPIGAAFGLHPLPLGLLAAIAGLLIAYLACAEAGKRVFFALERRRQVHRPWAEPRPLPKP